MEREGWRVRKDGSKFWAHVIITALHDERGRLGGFSKLTRDITERKRVEMALAERAEELLRSHLGGATMPRRPQTELFTEQIPRERECTYTNCIR